MTSRLEFDEESHRYTLDGKVLPSVTKIINNVLPTFQASQWHMDRGKRTHAACEWLDNGCDPEIDPEIYPRVNAWRKFRADYGGKIVANELRLASKLLRFAGTIDRVISTGKNLIIADLKNSVSPQVRLQLAGYSLLWKENNENSPKSAVAVELLDTGNYKCLWMDRHELRRAEQQFLALLSVYGFAETHNLLKGK